MARHPRKTSHNTGHNTKKKKNSAVSRKIRKLKKEGKPQKQAVAQAINTVRRKNKRS